MDVIMKMDGGSSVPRRQLGRQLRQLREQARITVKDAAAGLEVSPQKIWRIESGRGQERIRSVDVEALCRLYGAPAEVVTSLVKLAKESKAKGWWQSYADVMPDWFAPYVALETAARRIRQYEQMLVPGLLQTRAYAEAIYACRPELGEAERERAVSVRMDRQMLLAREFPPRPEFEVILSEAALRQPIADHGAMADQLRALLVFTEQPYITILVVPLAAGPSRASEAGSFVILEFPLLPGRVDREPTTIYSESLTGALYLDQPHEVVAYEQVWSALVAMALDEGESRMLIKSIIGELS